MEITLLDDRISILLTISCRFCRIEKNEVKNHHQHFEVGRW